MVNQRLHLVQQLYWVIANDSLKFVMFFYSILHSLVAVCAEDQSKSFCQVLL
jgi:hypothetical protein